MQLVPCRWQKSGWKYVEADPGTTRFFKSPHRVYSLGTSSFDKLPQRANVKRHHAHNADDDHHMHDTFKHTTYKSTYQT